VKTIFEEYEESLLPKGNDEQRVEYEQHTGQHVGVGCDPCFVINLKSVQIQGIDAGQHRFTERERDRSMSAYKRLRRQGLQPKNVFGSAEIEAQASSKFEVEHSVIMSPGIRKEMESRMTEAQAPL
jgi:hypothetical protein